MSTNYLNSDNTNSLATTEPPSDGLEGKPPHICLTGLKESQIANKTKALRESGWTSQCYRTLPFRYDASIFSQEHRPTLQERLHIDDQTLIAQTTSYPDAFEITADHAGLKRVTNTPTSSTVAFEPIYYSAVDIDLTGVRFRRLPEDRSYQIYRDSEGNFPQMGEGNTLNGAPVYQSLIQYATLASSNRIIRGYLYCFASPRETPRNQGYAENINDRFYPTMTVYHSGYHFFARGGTRVYYLEKVATLTQRVPKKVFANDGTLQLRDNPRPTAFSPVVQYNTNNSAANPSEYVYADSFEFDFQQSVPVNTIQTEAAINANATKSTDEIYNTGFGIGYKTQQGNLNAQRYDISGANPVFIDNNINLEAFKYAHNPSQMMYSNVWDFGGDTTNVACASSEVDGEVHDVVPNLGYDSTFLFSAFLPSNLEDGRRYSLFSTYERTEGSQKIELGYNHISGNKGYVELQSGEMKADGGFVSLPESGNVANNANRYNFDSSELPQVRSLVDESSFLTKGKLYNVLAYRISQNQFLLELDDTTQDWRSVDSFFITRLFDYRAIRVDIEVSDNATENLKNKDGEHLTTFHPLIVNSHVSNESGDNVCYITISTGIKWFHNNELWFDNVDNQNAADSNLDARVELDYNDSGRGLDFKTRSNLLFGAKESDDKLTIGDFMGGYFGEYTSNSGACIRSSEVEGSYRFYDSNTHETTRSLISENYFYPTDVGVVVKALTSNNGLTTNNTYTISEINGATADTEEGVSLLIAGQNTDWQFPEIEKHELFDTIDSEDVGSGVGAVTHVKLKDAKGRIFWGAPANAISTEISTDNTGFISSNPSFEKPMWYTSSKYEVPLPIYAKYYNKCPTACDYVCDPCFDMYRCLSGQELDKIACKIGKGEFKNTRNEKLEVKVVVATSGTTNRFGDKGIINLNRDSCLKFHRTWVIHEVYLCNNVTGERHNGLPANEYFNTETQKFENTWQGIEDNILTFQERDSEGNPQQWVWHVFEKEYLRLIEKGYQLPPVEAAKMNLSPDELSDRTGFDGKLLDLHNLSFHNLDNTAYYGEGAVTGNDLYSYVSRILKGSARWRYRSAFGSCIGGQLSAAGGCCFPKPPPPPPETTCTGDLQLICSNYGPQLLYNVSVRMPYDRAYDLLGDPDGLYSTKSGILSSRAGWSKGCGYEGVAKGAGVDFATPNTSGANVVAPYNSDIFAGLNKSCRNTGLNEDGSPCDKDDLIFSFSGSAHCENATTVEIYTILYTGTAFNRSPGDCCRESSICILDLCPGDICDEECETTTTPPPPTTTTTPVYD